MVIRPAYTMGGTGGGLVYNLEELRTIVPRGLAASLIHLLKRCCPVLPGIVRPQNDLQPWRFLMLGNPINAEQARVYMEERKEVKKLVRVWHMRYCKLKINIQKEKQK